MNSKQKQIFSVTHLIEHDILIIGDGYRAKNSELAIDGIPFARISNIDNGFHFESADRFPKANLYKVRNKISLVGDVVFTSKGTVGRFAFVDSQTETFVYSPQLCFWRVVDSQVIYPKFLYYWMRSREFYTQINRVKGSTDMADYVSLTDQRNMNISLPPLPTQRRIADILSALDDKIELNRQTNATLEAMAQAIFKEWFVHFNYPGATGERVESELGPIPAGWRVGSILEVADLLSGGTPSTRIEEYWNGDIDWVSAKDVSKCTKSFVIETERKITQLGIENSSTKLLPALTTIVTARGSVGNYCILAKPMTMNQTNYGLKAKSDKSDYFVFFTLGNLIAQLQKAAYGTIFDTITTITFKQSQITIPAYELVTEFDALVASMVQRSLENLEESITLARIRDALLSKLMRGEIDV